MKNNFPSVEINWPYLGKYDQIYSSVLSYLLVFADWLLIQGGFDYDKFYFVGFFSPFTENIFHMILM